MKEKEYLIESLLRDGTSQESRLNIALQEGYVEIDEQELEDFLFFIRQFSERVNYYNANNVLDGSWSEFFAILSDKQLISSALQDLYNTQLTPPHLSLLLAFLELYQIAIDDLNTLTKKHLDFYYQKVLQLNTRPPQPDKVHLLFELTRNIQQHLVKKGTRLKAGKDENGNEQLYEVKRDVVLNKASVSDLKSVFVDITGDSGIYASPVANSLDGLGEPLISEEDGWWAFGRDQQGLPDVERDMIEGVVGFGIASPQLLLKEGERNITFQLAVDTSLPHPTNQVFSNAFHLYFSGPEGWIIVENANANLTTLGTNTVLEIKVQLPPEFPSVVPFNKEILTENFDTQWPLVKMILNQDSIQYSSLKVLYFTSLTLSVDVKGVQDLIIQNDLGSLDTSKPFFPFGNSPTVGTNFYIGHDEVFQKKILDLTFNLHWAGLPEGTGFTAYYSGYPNPPISDTAFEATLKILDKHRWIPETADGRDNFPLFKSTTTGMETEPYTQEVDDQRIRLSRDPFIGSLSNYDRQTKRGFIRLTLNDPDFGHKDYPELYLNQTILKADPNVDPTTITLPNPPYAPQLQSLSLDYTSSETIDFNTPNGIEQFYHIESFGHKPLESNASISLVPQLESEGYFFIGVKDFVAPGNISLLFQIVEGSGDPDTILDTNDIQWSYLADNTWVSLSNLDVITDTTQGFQKSGLIELTIGRDATDDNTLMPAGLYWIRATIGANTASACRVIAVMSQAIEAEFVIDTSDEELISNHFINPLPENTISRLEVKDGAVKSVTQPYTSFGGRSYEQDQDYYVRISERLRHKKRPVSLWDYERMVLEAFTDIYKVKCLNHTNGGDNYVPGNITLIVIQNLRQKNAVNLLEPRADSLTLTNIKNYISGYISPFVEVKVENPVYEQLLVHFKVGFHPGFDPGFYGNLLNEEIKKFLSPWAFEEGVDIIFGGKVYKSDILAFIENREYVDFVNDFKLYHIFDGRARGGIDDMAIEIDFIVRPESPPGLGDMIVEEDFVIGEDSELAFATDSRAILVSAQNHYITVLKSGEYTCKGVEYEGIGFMTIGLDFAVAS